MAAAPPQSALIRAKTSALAVTPAGRRRKACAPVKDARLAVGLDLTQILPLPSGSLRRGRGADLGGTIFADAVICKDKGIPLCKQGGIPLSFAYQNFAFPLLRGTARLNS